ncbi:hypothetical protein LQW54_005799 [Pestalotiopsis sp. IQ-011]
MPGNGRRTYICHVRVKGKPCGRQSRDAYNHKRHLARKHGLAAAVPDEPARLDAGSDSGAALRGDTDSLPESDEDADAERSASRSPAAPRLRMSPTIDDVDDGQRRRWLSAARQQVPSYEVKRSRVSRHQQCALSWLSEDAVRHFGQYIRALLGSWGVDGADSESSCVLVPADWLSLNPVDILPLFGPDRCPKRRAERPRYKFDDHWTTLARAAAWFGKYPRTGVELDNFLGAGPFKTMDGSHLCHQDNCVNPRHICYEPSDANHDRKHCREEAASSRREGRGVPELCRRHETPCLMRLASLTTYEAYLIQFSVLRRALHIPEAGPAQRPAGWAAYPSLEDRLPLSAMLCEGSRPEPMLERAGPVAGAGDAANGRPSLVCPFCTAIKGFRRPTKLWAHLVHRHSASEDKDRLVQEVRRTASLWLAYWEGSSSEMGRAGGATKAKLLQALQGGFRWRDVVAWGLR